MECASWSLRNCLEASSFKVPFVLLGTRTSQDKLFLWYFLTFENLPLSHMYKKVPTQNYTAVEP